MDEFSSRTYGTSGLDNRPLFGETSARDRIINLAVGGFTSLVVLVTVISSFVFPSLPPRPLNVFFAVCILLACGSTILLIFWYRQGDLEPKFRNLIYYKLASIVLLCLCANLYFHDVRTKRSALLGGPYDKVTSFKSLSAVTCADGRLSRSKRACAL